VEQFKKLNFLICVIKKKALPLQSQRFLTMEDNFAIQLFEGKKVRIVWDEEQEKYYFAVADIVQVLTDSADVKQYIKKLRARDSELDSVWGTICTPHQFVSTDAKKHAVNCADLQGIFRIIQSVPSKKAEPVKQWLAQLGEQRIDQMIDPELTFQMAVEDYRRQGYSDKWINERMRSIEMRKELTDEWQRAGITEHKDFAILTNVLTQAWSGMTTGEYKRHKGLTKENLRDNMTNVELALNTLAEVATTELSRQRNPKGMVESKQAAQAGGKVAKNAREDLERQLGRSVISSERASDYLRPIEEGKAQELPFDDGTNDK
jgi:prophage antirepressor-like protein